MTMKKLAIPLLATVTALLLFTLMLTIFHASIVAILICQCCGAILLPYAVYRVLREPYHTSATFKDWYEDEPRRNN